MQLSDNANVIGFGIASSFVCAIVFLQIAIRSASWVYAGEFVSTSDSHFYCLEVAFGTSRVFKPFGVDNSVSFGTNEIPMPAWYNSHWVCNDGSTHFACGWPMPALRGVEHIEYSEMSINRPGVFVIGEVESSKARVLDSGRQIVVVPGVLVWPGLAINALSFGAPIALTWTLLPVAVRTWRRRKHACPACGFSMKGLQIGQPCPECGEREPTVLR